MIPKGLPVQGAWWGGRACKQGRKKPPCSALCSSPRLLPGPSLAPAACPGYHCWEGLGPRDTGVPLLRRSCAGGRFLFRSSPGEMPKERFSSSGLSGPGGRLACCVISPSCYSGPMARIPLMSRECRWDPSQFDFINKILFVRNTTRAHPFFTRSDFSSGLVLCSCLNLNRLNQQWRRTTHTHARTRAHTRVRTHTPSLDINPSPFGPRNFKAYPLFPSWPGLAFEVTAPCGTLVTTCLSGC